MIARDAAIVRRITLPRRLGDMQIGDGNELNALLAQVAGKPLQVGKGGLVHGERPVAILEIDIQPQHIGGQSILLQPRDHIAGLAGGHIAIARLLVTERPLRRERRFARQVGIASDHLGSRRPRDHIIIDRSVGCAEVDNIGIAVTEIEPGPPAVVEQQAVTTARSADRDEERDRLVDRVGRTGERVRIGIPVDEALAAPVKTIAGLVAQREDVFRSAQRLAQGKRLPVEAQRHRVISNDHPAGQIGDGQFKVGLDHHLHGAG